MAYSPFTSAYDPNQTMDWLRDMQTNDPTNPLVNFMNADTGSTLFDGSNANPYSPPISRDMTGSAAAGPAATPDWMDVTQPLYPGNDAPNPHTTPNYDWIYDNSPPWTMPGQGDPTSPMYSLPGQLDPMTIPGGPAPAAPDPPWLQKSKTIANELGLEWNDELFGSIFDVAGDKGISNADVRNILTEKLPIFTEDARPDVAPPDSTVDDDLKDINWDVDTSAPSWDQPGSEIGVPDWINMPTSPSSGPTTGQGEGTGQTGTGQTGTGNGPPTGTTQPPITGGPPTNPPPQNPPQEPTVPSDAPKQDVNINVGPPPPSAPPRPVPQDPTTPPQEDPPVSQQPWNINIGLPDWPENPNEPTVWGEWEQEQGQEQSNQNWIQDLVGDIDMKTVIDFGLDQYAVDAMSKSNKDALNFAKEQWSDYKGLVNPYASVGDIASAHAQQNLNLQDPRTNPQFNTQFDGNAAQALDPREVAVNQWNAYDPNDPALQYLQNESARVMKDAAFGKGKGISGGTMQALGEKFQGNAMQHAANVAQIGRMRDQSALESDAQRFGQTYDARSLYGTEFQDQFKRDLVADDAQYQQNMGWNQQQMANDAEQALQLARVMGIGANAATGTGSAMTGMSDQMSTLMQNQGQYDMLKRMGWGSLLT